VADHVEQVYELMGEAENLPDGPAKLALVQRAADIADSHQELELAFEVRKTLLGVCLGADACDLMLVTFTWCLAQHDHDPERFSAHRILWEFRWVVSSLCTFPQITREKIEEMKQEMARRYQLAGASPRSFWLMCRKMAADMGDVNEAVRVDRFFRRSPIDWLTDGHETEQGFEITYRLLRNQHDKALEAAEIFLTRKIRSDHFEGQACADVLLPMLRAGRAAEAMPFHRRGYKLRSRQIRHLDSIAKHIAFLALTDNLPRAVRLFEKHLAEAMKTSNAYNRMRFLIDTLPLLDRLKKSGKSAVKLRLPSGCPLSANGVTHSVAEVRKWMHATAADLAHTFDRRNGNDYYSKRLAAAPRLQRLFSPCALTR
jgi:hypothetical protein